MRAHPADVSDLGEVSRTVLVLRAAGLPPRLAGRDLVAALVRKQRGNGSFAGRVNTTAFAILALRAAGRSRSNAAVRRAAAWIAGQANADGGFNFAGRGGPSGVDDTGAAVQALAAAGKRGAAVTRRAATWLAGRQNPDGGFPLQPGAASNAQSTAWAIQGLLAAGRDPARVHRGGARDPLAYLRSLTGPTGEVRYSRVSRQTPVWVTAQAVMALARKPLPLAPVRRARRAVAAATATPAPTATPAAAAAPAPTATPRPAKPRARAAASPTVSPSGPLALVAAAASPSAAYRAGQAAGLVAAVLGAGPPAQ
jgi:energy-coupling factor transport system substrate-specific component